MSKQDKAFEKWQAHHTQLGYYPTQYDAAKVAFAAGREAERAAIKPCPLHDSARLLEFIVDMRGIRGNICKTCDGWGVYAYPTTATWHGGIGGQMFTSDVCDECWGSGDITYPWPNRRRIKEQE